MTAWVALKTSGSSTRIAISEVMSKKRRQFSSVLSVHQSASL
jgi:hypothetical protein